MTAMTGTSPMLGSAMQPCRDGEATAMPWFCVRYAMATLSGFRARLRAGAALAALALFLPATGAASDEGEDGGGQALLVDRVAAIVGDDVILESDVKARAGPMLSDVEGIADADERERRRADVVERVLDQMIEEELMMQAAGQANVEISDQEIDQAIREVRSQNNLGEAEFREALRMQGYTMEEYREDLEQQMLRMRATEMLVRPRVSVSEDDVRARYQEMERGAGDVGRVRLSHILVEVPDGAGDEASEEARAHAEELVERAREDDSFAELAQTYSDDDATRADGGRLGWIDRGSLATEWENLVFAMEEGEVDGPVSGSDGYHVFYVEELERDDLPSFEEKEQTIREELFQAEMERETEKFVSDLRERVHVEVKLDT